MLTVFVSNWFSDFWSGYLALWLRFTQIIQACSIDSEIHRKTANRQYFYCWHSLNDCRRQTVSRCHGVRPFMRANYLKTKTAVVVVIVNTHTYIFLVFVVAAHTITTTHWATCFACRPAAFKSECVYYCIDIQSLEIPEIYFREAKEELCGMHWYFSSTTNDLVIG